MFAQTRRLPSAGVRWGSGVFCEGPVVFPRAQEPTAPTEPSRKKSVI